MDPAVPGGSVEIPGSPDDVLFVEAEWYIEFADGIGRYLDNPEAVRAGTPVVVQGMIEGKWMNRLLGTRAWQPASVGNNVLAQGRGIHTTVGALDGEASGETRIVYELASREDHVHTASLRDLRGENIADLLRDVLRACGQDGEQLDGIDIGAIGEAAAVVNESQRLKSAVRRSLLPHRVKERLVRVAIADGLALPPGTPAELTTRDASGAVVGEASLTWRSS